MPNGANDGMLAWSIGFSDAVRSEATRSRSRSLSETSTLHSNTSTEYDSLLGTSDAIVGVEAATKQPLPAEGKIRGTLILTLPATIASEQLSVSSGVTNISTTPFTEPFLSSAISPASTPLRADIDPFTTTIL